MFNPYFIQGLTTPFRAFRFMISRPKLLVLSLFPLVIAFALFMLFLSVLLGSAWAIAHSAALAFLNQYSGIVFLVLGLAFLVAVLFFSSSLLSLLFKFAASPFNDMLAERTEAELGVSDLPPWTLGRTFRIFWVDLRKTLISIFAGIVFSLGMLIPIANAVFFIGLSLLNAFTFISYPQSRREQGLLESSRWIRRHFALSLGFGITTTVLMSIPVFGIMMLPVSIVGGTILYLESQKITTEDC